MDQPRTLPLIGDKAPAFKADTTAGQINFPNDYNGKWVILFSHPADFTPVCTTEFMAFAAMDKEFKSLGCELIGLSIDSTFSHIAWLRTIRERIQLGGAKGVQVNFPVIADLKMEVSKAYGMIQPNASTTQTVRAVFIIDPEATVRAVLYYPMSCGRNLQEIRRMLVAIQTADKHKVATPANWQPGQDVIVPPPKTAQDAEERVCGAGKDYQCLDWFLSLKKL